MNWKDLKNTPTSRFFLTFLFCLFSSSIFFADRCNKEKNVELITREGDWKCVKCGDINFCKLRFCKGCFDIRSIHSRQCIPPNNIDQSASLNIDMGHIDHNSLFLDDSNRGNSSTDHDTRKTELVGNIQRQLFV